MAFDILRGGLDSFEIRPSRKRRGGDYLSDDARKDSRPKEAPEMVANCPGLMSALDEDSAFEVDVHGPTGDVGAADDGGVGIDDDELDVESGAGRPGRAAP
jgi:hypothetical protein